MPGSNPVIRKLRERFGDGIEDLTTFKDDPVARVPRELVYEAVEFLKTDPELDFAMFVDLCGADYPDRTERFEVNYNLRSFKANQHVRLKVRLSAGDAVLPTVTPLFEAANWFERETFDMFGITFDGHPNLRRILTHDQFEGHPLRKDYMAMERHPCTETTELD